ncbi:MAG: hypothetical protein NVS1B4_20150 [Gemmatimonadaceae bacterium]
MQSSSRNGLTATVLAAAVLVAACRGDAGVAPPPKPSVVPVSCPATLAPLSLAPGEVKTLTDPQLIGCVRIAASASPSSYLFVPYNGNPAKNVTEQVRLTVNPGTFVASVVPASSQTPATMPMARAVVDEAVFRDPVEGRIRMAERELYATRTAFASAPTSPGRSSVVPALATLPGPFTVGQSLTMYVPDTSTVPSYCKAFETITGVVKSIGTRGVVIQDAAAPAGGFSQVQFDSIAGEFDNLVWRTDSAHFGTPSDIDANGKVVLLITPLVNALTPRGAKGFTAGFFFSGDLYPTAQCAGSNGGELFYLIAPDPNGVINGNPRSTTFVRETIRGVVAHEFQHMINAGNRLFLSRGAPEEVWLDEGLAHFAEELVGRAARGYADMQLLTYADTQNPLSPSDYPAFFRQNFARATQYLVGPDTTGPTHDRSGDPQGPSQLGYRGASWAFLRWVADHYAAADVAAFTRRLAYGPTVGVANLTAAASNVPFDQLVAPWLVSLYADHNTAVTLVDPVRYQFLSWDFRSAISGANSGFYPLRPINIGAGTNLAGQLASSSGNFYLLTNSGSTPAAVVQVTTATGSALTFPGAGLAILRVN